MDFQAWIPIIVAIATAVASLLVWVFQKSRERKDQIRQHKQELYESLLLAIAEFPANNTAPFFVESPLAWLYASDDVLRSIQSVFDALIAKKLYSEDGTHALGNLLLEMRRDTLDETEISEEWVKGEYKTGHPPIEDIVKYVQRRASKSKA